MPAAHATAQVAIVGGGPAGLMAAERLSGQGIAVDLYDSKASVGRKFLLAGKGGLNLTHSEARVAFVGRYRERSTEISRWLDEFDATALRNWCEGLGVATFVGSSGRVFPTDMKAAPLLRAWLTRLRAAGVRFHMRHRWTGWDEAGRLCFDTPEGPDTVAATATLLALGGASWPQLGSDGRWVDTLAARGVTPAPLRATNCGFDLAWSPHFSERHAGQPLKNVRIAFTGIDGTRIERSGECLVSAHGLEGSLIYALSAGLRECIERDGRVKIDIDLLPALDAQKVLDEVSRPRGARSLSSHLNSRLGVSGVRIGLLHEVLDRAAMNDMKQLARTLKALPLTLLRTRPVEEAISTAGGVRLEDLDAGLMLKALPGVFCAGEMLDWEAPTGGYLLTATMASGRVAADGIAAWLAGHGG
ncbi:TIGR03862 family flavoprotein [Methyloversatilis universalis]|uniref:TIGR03862 family flavoprotein n=1 Tax=Methyloversatilis universalis TaxID=378211 RepID=UPI0003794949|nr:TIGR03862 family flavoprotein [Methyloversatilis universalis]